MINSFSIELCSLVISLLALVFGMAHLFKKGEPKYFQAIVCAIGCYTLEELWVIVNEFCKTEGSLFSIRLVGIFGCFCFFLSANNKEYDILFNSNSKDNALANAFAIVAPIIFIGIFTTFVIINHESKSILRFLIIFIVLLPAIVDSYFKLKYILIHTDTKGCLKSVRGLNAVVLLFYLICFVYLFPHFISHMGIEIYWMDVLSSITMAATVILSVRGAKKWKALT